MLVVLIASSTIAIFRGGHFATLSRHHWRLPLLAVLAVAVQALALLPDANASSSARMWAASVYVFSYLLLGAFVWVNRRTPWLWVVGTGLAANALVIIANGGFMPILPRASLDALARGIPAGTVYHHSILVGNDTRLEFLADIFHTPAWLPLRRTLSIGDLLMAAGTFGLVQRLMKPPATAPVSQYQNRHSGPGAVARPPAQSR